jgi:hypothetical protein
LTRLKSRYTLRRGNEAMVTSEIGRAFFGQPPVPPAQVQVQ